MANPNINYNATIISPGIDLRITGAGTPNISAAYTDRTAEGGTPPSTDMAHCTVAISYTNVQWTVNNDNSVTVTGNITNASWTRTQAYSGQSYYQYEVWFKFNGSEVYRTTVQANEPKSVNQSSLGIPATFSVTIPPRTTSTAASIHFFSKSVGYTYDPDEFTVGLIIENPNYPDYRPGKIYNGTTWQSHNRSGGAANIRTSTGLREMRTSNGGVDSDNPPTIRHASAFKNMRKSGSE